MKVLPSQNAAQKVTVVPSLVKVEVCTAALVAVVIHEPLMMTEAKLAAVSSETVRALLRASVELEPVAT